MLEVSLSDFSVHTLDLTQVPAIICVGPTSTRCISGCPVRQRRSIDVVDILPIFIGCEPALLEYPEKNRNCSPALRHPRVVPGLRSGVCCYRYIYKQLRIYLVKHAPYYRLERPSPRPRDVLVYTNDIFLFARTRRWSRDLMMVLRLDFLYSGGGCRPFVGEGNRRDGFATAGGG